MDFDDVIYLALLVACVTCGPYVRNMPSVKERRLTSTIIGLVVVFMVSGLHIVHPLIVTVVNAFIILHVNKKKCQWVSFVFCFSYLAFFRLAYYIGLPAPPAHTNAVQMILTLKMVGLAFEINMLHLLEKSEDKDRDLKIKYTKIDPSFFDVFQYSFCFSGVLIGPYYKYRTYIDAFNAPFAPHVKSEMFLVDRILFIPLYAFLYLLGSYLFPLDYASTTDILDDPMWFRLFYMTPMFFNFRMRIYIGFILGECTCMNMGMGAYPVRSVPKPGAGPTNYKVLQEMEAEKTEWSSVEYNFESIKNINEYGSEFLPTIREGIRSWNRTVQYWLATFVYKETKASKPVKMLVTMLASSFWHGVHAGYYLCLMSAPLFLLAEAEVEKAFRRNASHFRVQIFNWIWWVIKMQSFSYMGVAFLLLDISTIWRYWTSIYFFGHIFIIVTYILAFCKNRHLIR